MHFLHPTIRLVLRWVYIAVLTLVAFRLSLLSLAATTRAGGLGGYAWTVPAAGILAAIGFTRRERSELPIHDRQTDVIVGGMGLVLALLLHAVLLQRYALYFHLLRLDLLAMWTFVVSASIVLFGLRPVARFFWVWALVLMVFPLPYYIAVIFLGGGNAAAAAGTIVIAGFATWIGVGRTWQRGLLATVLAWGPGLLILWAMTVFFPAAPLFAFQMIPAMSAIVLVGMGMYLYARRGRPKRIMDRKVEPLAASQVWAGLPVVLIVAIALAFVRLPTLVSPSPARVDDPGFGSPLIAPPGWHVTNVEDYPWVARMFGTSDGLIRQQMVADDGNPQWDKLSRPRTVMVDSVTTDRPITFDVYPAKVLYDVSASRLSKALTVDLGHGVTGQLVSVVDDKMLITWNALQWTWRNEDKAQRVLVFAVDNHEVDAPFPKPTGALFPTLNTLFTVLFRGNSAVADRNPTFKDADLLTQFGRAIVAAQLHSAGATG